MPYQKFELDYTGRKITVETGHVAEQANGAILIRSGDTMLLVTAVGATAPREGIDFFPLTCDYEEKLYAAGRIPGSFPRREGRPTEAAILACRLMDRPLRPLFPKDFRNDVQVVATVLSTDQENDPVTLAVTGASLALAISDIPHAGPVGCVRVGRTASPVKGHPRPGGTWSGFETIVCVLPTPQRGQTPSPLRAAAGERWLLSGAVPGGR